MHTFMREENSLRRPLRISTRLSGPSKLRIRKDTGIDSEVNSSATGIFYPELHIGKLHQETFRLRNAGVKGNDRQGLIIEASNSITGTNQTSKPLIGKFKGGSGQETDVELGELRTD